MLSYTATGAIVGALGTALRFSTAAQAAIQLIAAAAMLVMAPAVYRGQQTQENRRTLENLGYVFLGPVDAGSGKGALASADAIAEKITDMLNPELWGAYI